MCLGSSQNNDEDRGCNIYCHRFLTINHHHLILFPHFTQCKNSSSMTSTPPRKGKKRQAPQTPTGRPPAKASRPTSPSAMTGGSPHLSTLSDLPAIPPFRQPPKATRTPPTPTAGSSAVPMDEDLTGYTPDPDTLAFTTGEDALPDEEVASSFKEMLD
jgi:hypothetical protein